MRPLICTSRLALLIAPAGTVFLASARFRRITRLAIVFGVSAAATTAFADPPPYVYVTTIHAFSNTPTGSGSFLNAEGGHPRAGLLEGSDGKLYGTTWLAGPGMSVTNNKGTCDEYDPSNRYLNYCPGTIYSINKNGTSFSVLHAFSQTDHVGKNNDGNQPAAALTQGTDGYLYGTATKGGNALATHGCGTAFKLMTNGTNYTVLHSFCSTTSNGDGASPYGTLAQNGDGYVYGAASHGNAANTGVIFKLATDGSSITALHSFSATSGGSNVDGAIPYGSPIIGATNTLFGFTGLARNHGGAYAEGTVYSVTTGGMFSPLHSFCAPGEWCGWGHLTDDANLQNLIKGSDGNFYGTVEYGGSYGNGIVFKITPSRTFTVLHEFSSIRDTTTPRFMNCDGANPLGTLVEGRYGFLYGTTYYGGANGTGGIFQISMDGSSFVFLYSFTSDGTYPYAGVIYASDGNYYGTTFLGGANRFGTIYKMSPPGTMLPVFNAEPNTVYTSSPITMAGLTGNTITITGGEYSVNGGAFTSSPGTIHTNDTLQVRVTSAPTYNTRMLGTVFISSMGNESFAVTTKAGQ
jgi:uncharacterized repeat protein (TIGR03803 family)